MLEELSAILLRVSFKDVVEIFLIGTVIYQFLLLIKGTRGWQITLGIVALVLFYYLVRLFELRTVEWFLANFFTYFVFALIVIFQSELRRGLAKLGRGRFLTLFNNRTHRKLLDEVVLAATTLASQKTGGLIILEREIGLRNYIESGIKLDAYLTYDLLVTIFNPNTPLHDGSVIIRDERIAAAGCFLPLTLDPYLSKELGTRHRAAIGITEETDAVAVVVSEETGIISAVCDRELTRNLDDSSLLQYLREKMLEQQNAVDEGVTARDQDRIREETV